MEYAKKYAPKWRKENPLKSKVSVHNYQARRRKADGTFTPDEFEQLCMLVDKKCVCCKQQGKLTIDHIIPLSWGGSNDIKNIQPLCDFCNYSKNNHHATDYRPDFLKLWVKGLEI